jgi:hypothetical protein
MDGRDARLGIAPNRPKGVLLTIQGPRILRGLANHLSTSTSTNVQLLLSYSVPGEQYPTRCRSSPPTGRNDSDDRRIDGRPER